VLALPQKIVEYLLVLDSKKIPEPSYPFNLIIHNQPPRRNRTPHRTLLETLEATVPYDPE
jgi:hypothetical protein